MYMYEHPHTSSPQTRLHCVTSVTPPPPPTHPPTHPQRRGRRRRHPNTVIPLNFLPPPTHPQDRNDALSFSPPPPPYPTPPLESPHLAPETHARVPPTPFVIVWGCTYSVILLTPHPTPPPSQRRILNIGSSARQRHKIRNRVFHHHPHPRRYPPISTMPSPPHTPPPLPSTPPLTTILDRTWSSSFSPFPTPPLSPQPSLPLWFAALC